MHQITDTLLVGNILDAERPPATVGAVLLVAEEFSIDGPAGVIYDRIPLKEYGEAAPALLDRAVTWIERHGEMLRSSGEWQRRERDLPEQRDDVMFPDARDNHDHTGVGAR